jgi:hypothetical protein
MMFGCLYVDGKPVDMVEAGTQVELDLAYGGPEYECDRCGVELVETVEGFVDEQGAAACVGDGFDGDAEESDRPPVAHAPRRRALAWCNGLRIGADPGRDALTLRLSVGGERTRLPLTVRRMPDDSPWAGQLVLEVDGCAEQRLEPIGPGTVLIGAPTGTPPDLVGSSAAGERP